jgi:mandelate racemase
MTATTLTIRDIRARPVMVPCKRPPISASGALPHAALVLIDLETDDGVTGRSYIFGFAQWTLKPIVGCLANMRDLLKGDHVAPFNIEAKLRSRLTLLDTPGLVGSPWPAWTCARGMRLRRRRGCPSSSCSAAR